MNLKRKLLTFGIGAMCAVVFTVFPQSTFAATNQVDMNEQKTIGAIENELKSTYPQSTQR